MTDYLHRCHALFGETMQERHGKRPDHDALERELEPVRTNARPLAYRDLETIQNPRYWDFRQFWRFPAEGEIDQGIDRGHMSRLIQRLPLDEATTIERLHTTFKYIQSVSVLLRFIHPRHYGILSAPVEKVLEVRRGRTEVETFLNYLVDLRAIRDHYGFERAADADMALWVLQERVLSAYRDADLLASYRADVWLHRRRAINLLAPLDAIEDRLELARSLAEVNVTLAGSLAAAEFERRLRAVVGEARPETDHPEPWRRGSWLRDRMHDPAREPTREEVHELIDRAHEVEASGSRDAGQARGKGNPDGPVP